jgi:hypothetical protein
VNIPADTAGTARLHYLDTPGSEHHIRRRKVIMCAFALNFGMGPHRADSASSIL